MNKILKKILLTITILTSTFVMAIGHAEETKLTTDHGNYHITSNIEVHFSGMSGHYQDWIGIYHKGDSSDWNNVVAWRWTGGAKNGTVNFENTLDMGVYEIRAFFRNRYEPKATTSIRSFIPGSTGPDPLVRSDRVEYTPNAPVTAMVEGYLSGDRDWIGIYAKGDNNDWNNVIRWNWVNHVGNTVSPTLLNQMNKGNGKLPAGEYEVRLFFRNTYNDEAVDSFTVLGKAGPVDNGAYRFPNPGELTYLATRNITRPQKEASEDINRASVIDPQFGSTITLVKNAANVNDSGGASYPKFQSWNANMSLIRIGSRLYDANTLKESTITSSEADKDDAFAKIGSPWGGIFIWSYRESNVFYTLTIDKKLKKNTIQGDEVNSEIWFDFDIIADSLSRAGALRPNEKFVKITYSKGEAHFDKENKWVVFTAKRNNDDSVYALLCNAHGTKQERQTCKMKKLPDSSWGYVYVDGSERDVFDWIAVTPNGDHIVIAQTINVHKYADANGVVPTRRSVNNQINYQPETRLFMYDMNFENRQEIAPNYGHGDIGIDENGDQVVVQFDWRPNSRSVVSYNLDAPAGQRKKILLPNVYGGGHISCQNYLQRPGWCSVNTRMEGYKEIFALKLDGKRKVSRFVQTRHNGSPYGAISPDGKRVLFRSNWGGSTQVYHAALKN